MAEHIGGTPFTLPASTWNEVDVHLAAEEFYKIEAGKVLAVLNARLRREESFARLADERGWYHNQNVDSAIEAAIQRAYIDFRDGVL